jgi:hypothetical protein
MPQLINISAHYLTYYRTRRGYGLMRVIIIWKYSRIGHNGSNSWNGLVLPFEISISLLKVQPTFYSITKWFSRSDGAQAMPNLKHILPKAFRGPELSLYYIWKKRIGETDTSIILFYYHSWFGLYEVRIEILWGRHLLRKSWQRSIGQYQLCFLTL